MQVNKVIKVKDTKFIGVLFALSALFPVGVILLCVESDLNYIISTLIALLCFIIAGVVVIMKIKRDEEVYEIVADKNTISIRHKGTFTWNEIITIETFAERRPGERGLSYFLKLNITNGKPIILKANHFDLWYEDLKNELLSLKENYVAQQDAANS